MNAEAFRAWMKHMGFYRIGGQRRAATVLSCPVGYIRNWERGMYLDGAAVRYPFYLDLAMAALAADLKPWSEQIGQGPQPKEGPESVERKPDMTSQG